MKLNKLQIAALAALVATPIFAYIGDRIFAIFAAYPLGIDAITNALNLWWQDICVDPFYFSLNQTALIGAMFCGIIPLIAFAVYCANYQQNTRQGEEQGSAHKATPEELAGFTFEKNPDGRKNSLLLTENVALAIKRKGFSRKYDRNLNVLVIGGSGAGKTRYYVKPNVGQMSMDMFITDPKGDGIYDYGDLLHDNGYNIRCFNTFLPYLSLVYNPLEYVHSDLDVISFAHMLVSMTEEPNKSGGDAFWTKAEIMLYTALVSYLRDYAEPDDYNIGGIIRLLAIAKVQEENENFKSGLDLIFEELATGKRKIRTSKPKPKTTDDDGDRLIYDPNGEQGFRTIDSPLVRKSDGKAVKDARNKDGKQGFNPVDDFSLLNYTNFKQAAGKTLKSIIISCNVRLNPFTTDEVKGITCGRDEMHLEKLGGERTGKYKAHMPNGEIRERELTDYEAKLIQASGIELEPYFVYKTGETKLQRDDRRRYILAKTDEKYAKEVLDSRVLQMKSNAGLLSADEIERAKELGVTVTTVEDTAAHIKSIQKNADMRGIDLSEGISEFDYGADSNEISAIKNAKDRDEAEKQAREEFGRHAARIAKDNANAGVFNIGKLNAKRVQDQADNVGKRIKFGKHKKEIEVPDTVAVTEVLTREEAKARGFDDLDRVNDRVAPGEPKLDEKNAIFAIFKDTDQKTLGFLHGIMVYQTVNLLCQKALEDFNGRLPRFVNFILDEYRSLSLPEDISAMISVVRSRNIAMSIILQGISQLGELYKEDAKKSIIACCDTTLFLGSQEDETKKYMSDLCGVQTVVDTNFSSSYGQSGSWSKSQNKFQRPLYTADEISRLDNDHAIVVIRAANPCEDQKINLEAMPFYSEMDGSRRFNLAGYMERLKAGALQENQYIRAWEKKEDQKKRSAAKAAERNARRPPRVGTSRDTKERSRSLRARRPVEEVRSGPRRRHLDSDGESESGN